MQNVVCPKFVRGDCNGDGDGNGDDEGPGLVVNGGILEEVE